MTTPRARWNRFAVYVGVNIAGFVCLAAYGHQISSVNYHDHLRSCEAQNEGRISGNQFRAAMRLFVLSAAEARTRAALAEPSGPLRENDLAAAKHYRKLIPALHAVPIFDCKRVVEAP